MLLNPAGLAFSEKTLHLSGTFTGIKAIADAKVDGVEYKTRNALSTPLAFHASFKIYDNLQAGVSFFTPYGSSINWTDNWPGAVLSQKVDLATYTIQPTLSWKITPRLSVGAGLMLTWGSVDLNKGLVSSSSLDRLLTVLQATGASQAMGLDPSYRFGTTTPASVNLKGTSDVAVGVNVGAMFDVSDRVTVGASFRSKMMMKVKAGEATVDYANEVARAILEGDLNIINSANFAAEMPCPYVLNFGVSYRPTSRLTLALDAQLTGWHAYRHLDIDFLAEQLTPYDQHLTKNYSNAWAVKAGAQYALTQRLDLRAGMMIDTTPVSTLHYNPETPGMTKIEPAVGFSFRPIGNISIDVAFMYVAGLGEDNASCTYTDLLAARNPALQLPAETTFKANYSVKAFVPSIGISYSF
ncbi:MAG: outer membrane protein transport protein [Paramuribaculum sp.]|nr:outer membrane protein transport protein [Paramuribaculum sp.]